MSKTDIVTINHKQYDARTGLLISSETAKEVTRPSVPRPRDTQAVASTSVHATTQKSKTLKRTIVKKTAAPRTPGRVNDIIRHRSSVQKSPHVIKFAHHPVVAQKTAKPVHDIAPTHHPLAVRVQQKRHVAAIHHDAPISLSASVIKQQAIEKALATPATKATEQRKSKSLKTRFPRIFSLASASMAVLLLAGYLTYLNMPAISIRVAAAGAGIQATYPDYRPDGYRLAGPIAYSDGEVNMQFVANAGSQNFVIKEAESPWDSTAVLENYVLPKTDGEYVIHNENGLTIYTYDNDAAWVNGGILYTISGDAPLSNEQLRRIAVSL